MKTSKNWYKRNKKYWIDHVKKHQKKTNYASEKTPEQRKIRYIKRRTRLLYPLYKCLKCKFCDNGATEHHHNTFPIEIDKFNYICHECHLIHNHSVKSENVLQGG